MSGKKTREKIDRPRVHKSVYIDTDIFERINKYRSSERRNSLPDAINALLLKGLEAWGKEISNDKKTN